MVVEIWSAVGLVRPTWSRRGLKVFRVPHRHLRNRAGAAWAARVAQGGWRELPLLKQVAVSKIGCGEHSIRGRANLSTHTNHLPFAVHLGRAAQQGRGSL